MRAYPAQLFDHVSSKLYRWSPRNTSTAPPPSQPSVEAGPREASSNVSAAPVDSFWKDLPRFRAEYKVVEAWPLIEPPGANEDLDDTVVPAAHDDEPGPVATRPSSPLQPTSGKEDPVYPLPSHGEDTSYNGNDGSVTAVQQGGPGLIVTAARSPLGQQNAVDLPRSQTNWSHSDGLPAVIDLPSLSGESPITFRNSLPFAVRGNVYGYVLPAHILPEHASEALRFRSRDKAVHGTETCVTGWKGCEGDDTIPHNDEHRRAWVLRLKLAMKNRDGLLNKGMHGNRWSEGKSYPYAEDAVEKVCWDIVYLAEQLHLHGLRDFPIYDPDMYKNLESNSQLTFQERMELLITNLCFFKSKCEIVMKGEGVALMVAGPRLKLRLAKSNKKNNGQRGEQLKIARVANKQRARAEGLTQLDAIHITDDEDDGEKAIRIPSNFDIPELPQELREDSLIDDLPDHIITTADRNTIAEYLATFDGRGHKHASPDDFEESVPKRSRLKPKPKPTRPSTP